MPTLTLTEAQQLALRALMSIEPTPGCSMPTPEVLRLIEKLVPCDAMGIGVVDNDGCLMQEVVLRHDFTDEDLARLALVLPILQRLLRVRPTPHRPAALTVQERRVLMLVANGLSNPEIAARLFVSVATVRKHLEHAYRKLGVHNRMAAVVAFEGGPVAHPERAGMIEKYA